MALVLWTLGGLQMLSQMLFEGVLRDLKLLLPLRFL